MHEQAVQEPEVAARDADDGSLGLGVGDVGFVKGEAELAPLPGQDEGEFIALLGPVVVSKTDATVELGIAR